MIADNDDTYGPVNAIDGDKDTIYSSSDMGYFPQSLQINLRWDGHKEMQAKQRRRLIVPVHTHLKRVQIAVVVHAVRCLSIPSEERVLGRDPPP